MNFLIAEERSLDHKLQEQKNKIRSLAANWLIANSSIDSSEVTSLANRIKENIDSLLLGQSNQKAKERNRIKSRIGG